MPLIKNILAKALPVKKLGPGTAHGLKNGAKIEPILCQAWVGLRLVCPKRTLTKNHGRKRVLQLHFRMNWVDKRSKTIKHLQCCASKSKFFSESSDGKRGEIGQVNLFKTKVIRKCVCSF